jgi:hypothetical protein
MLAVIHFKILRRPSYIWICKDENVHTVILPAVFMAIKPCSHMKITTYARVLENRVLKRIIWTQDRRNNRRLEKIA